MQKRKKKMYAQFGAIPVAGLGLVVAAGLLSCEDQGWGGSSRICSDFRVGTDLTRVDWELEGQDNVDFGVTMQAISDVSIAAASMASDLGVACRALSIEMGEPAESVDERIVTDQAERTKAWCTVAASAIKKLMASGALTVNAQSPTCMFGVSTQASCEQNCTENIECEAALSDLDARCEPSDIAGKCEGMCSGSCDGSANVKVACSGECSGTCLGACSGACSAVDGAGSCQGACDGICEGECQGSCNIISGQSVQCSGSCMGGCDAAYQASTCTAELAPPSTSCSGSTACNVSCQAIASTKAECALPAVAFRFDGAPDADIEKKIASLELWLPEILRLGKARGPLIADNTQLVAELGIDYAAALSGDAIAVLCVSPALSTISDAVINAEATLIGSFEVLSAAEAL